MMEIIIEYFHDDFMFYYWISASRIKSKHFKGISKVAKVSESMIEYVYGIC